MLLTTHIQFSSLGACDQFFIHLQLLSRHIPKVVVGNKCDLEEKREVTREEGQRMADNYGATFFEISAKTNVNVYEVCVY